MKLAIAGGRDFDDIDLLVSILWDLLGVKRGPKSKSKDKATIISGGARGADRLAKNYALEEELEYIEFLPDWDGLGKAAGFIRNQQIVDACDMLLAFWDGKSKGTEHTISLAKKAKKPTLIVYY